MSTKRNAEFEVKEGQERLALGLRLWLHRNTPDHSEKTAEVAATPVKEKPQFVIC